MSRTAPPGFSLIESALALGVVSTVLLTIIMLLPQGLNAVRDSHEQLVEARIADRLRQQCLAAMPSEDTYFDAHGVPLKTHSVNATFVARVEEAGSVPLPGSTTGGLRDLKLSISRHVGLDSFADPRQVSVYHLMLAPRLP